MKGLKKSIALLLTVLMISSLTGISASASSWRLDEILEDYQTIAPTYTNDEKVTISKTASETENKQHDMSLEPSYTTCESKLCYFTFKTEADAATGEVEYRLSSSKSQVRIFINYESGSVAGRDGSVKRTSTKEIETDVENSVKILLDYGEDKYYVWINDDEEPYLDGLSFSMPDSDYSTNFSVIISAAKSGSVYIDDFTVTPMEKRVFMPVATEYLYEETFDSYNAGQIYTAATDTTPETDQGNLVKDRVLVPGTGNNKSDPENLIIEQKTSGDMHMKIDGNVSQEPHTWFFSKKTTYPEGTKGIAIQYDIKGTGGAYLDFGAGNRNNAAHLQVTANSTDVSIRDGAYAANQPTTALEKNLLDGKYHTLTWLFVEDGDNDKYSLWIDGVRMVENAGLWRGISNYEDLDAIVFRADAATKCFYIDNLRVFEVNEGYFNVEKVDSSIDELADICTAVADSAPVDFKTADAIKEASGLTDNTSTTVTIIDSKGYYNGSNIIFPLYADTTDVAVRITDGNTSTTKRFKNVSIPAAYTIGTPQVNAVTAGQNNAAGTIPATVRNAASDNGRLMVIAALYDSATGKMLAVQTQKNTLDGGSAFNCELDLTNVEQLPANTTVRLFVWDGATLIPLV